MPNFFRTAQKILQVFRYTLLLQTSSIHFSMTQKSPMAASPADNDVWAVEYQAFQKASNADADPTMLILRAHLFSESLLERLIALKLRRGDKIIDSGSFTFAQKLILAEAIDSLDDSIATSLRNLNKLRNQCAHELGRTITAADVTRIGSPIGKYFTKLQRETNYEPVSTLRVLLSYVCGYITGVCNAIEEAHAAEYHSEPVVVSGSQSATTAS